jgi:hypothetical protein
MNKAIVVTAMLLLSSPFPAFSQNAAGADRRDSSTRIDRDLDELLRGGGDYSRGVLRRGGGAAFFLRNGDATVAVRCDPQDSMKSCVDNTLTLLDKARSMQPSGATQGGTPGGQPPSR